MESVLEGLQSRGLKISERGGSEDLTSQELRIINQSLPEEMRNSLNRVDVTNVDKAVLANGDDKVTVIDFHAAFKDPLVIIEEKVKGRTSTIVDEILHDTVQTDILTNALLHGIMSAEFKQSIVDMADLKNVGPNKLYDHYVRVFRDAMEKSLKISRTYAKPFEHTKEIMQSQAIAAEAI